MAARHLVIKLQRLPKVQTCPSLDWNVNVGQGISNLDWHKILNLLVGYHMHCITCEELLLMSMAKKTCWLLYKWFQFFSLPLTLSKSLMNQIQRALQCLGCTAPMCNRSKGDKAQPCSLPSHEEPW